MALSRRARLGLVGAFIVIALSLTLAGNEPDVQYSVDQIMESPEDHSEGQIHLRGSVTVGSYDSENRSFQLVGDSHFLEVDATSTSIPPAFEEGRVVAIKGELTKVNGEWVLNADEIITGCPSKYESE